MRLVFIFLLLASLFVERVAVTIAVPFPHADDPSVVPLPRDDVLAHLRRGHPRLLFTDEQLATAVAGAKTDPLRAQLHARVVALAEAELDTPPIQHVLVGPRLLDKSRTCLARVLDCAMAFRLTGDARFATRAKKELLTAAGFDDWNPSHFLDVAEMSLAFAIGYDWLYAQLTPSERATLKAAMLQHGLVFARAAYAERGQADKSLWWTAAPSNWNQVCNGGLLAAALALADEEPAIARLVVAGTRKSLPVGMAAYAPDGGYPEGPDYWGYGTAYNVIAIALLESALGTDFDLSAAPGFDMTAGYRLYIQSPAGPSFNYGDSGPSIGAQAEYTWLASRFKHAEALAHSRALLADALAKQVKSSDTSRFFALHVVWFPDDSLQPSPSLPPSLDVRFRGQTELAMLRSAWDDPRALFVGFKAGRNDVSHAHLDLGSFVLDADGMRWAQDIGPDDYNLPGYFDLKTRQRFSYYRLNNHSHNTLTLGDAFQDSIATARIVAFASTPRRAFAVADLTSVYPGKAETLLRGVALLDRARVLVQDDVSGLKGGTAITWRLLTSARVEVPDPRHATLVQNGCTLRAEILTPSAATFYASPAKAPTAAEKRNDDVTVLAAKLTPDSPDTRLAVLLTPVGAHWPSALPLPTVVPLADWH